MIKHMCLISVSFGLLSMPTLATAQNATINALSGDVVARGQGVDVSLQVTCNGLSSPIVTGITTTLTERVGNKVTTGTGSTCPFGCPITCGSPQTFEFLATLPNPPTSPGNRWGPGPAIAQTTAIVFDTVNFFPLNQTNVIKLKQ
jgi:hypothetical protein